MKKLIAILSFILLFTGCRKVELNETIPQENTTKSVKFFTAEDELPKFEPNTILVSLHNNQSKKSISKLNITKHVWTKTMQRNGDNGFYKVKTSNPDSLLKILRSNPEVKQVSLNYSHKTQGIPDDPYFNSGEMWGLQKINANQAWASGNYGSQQIAVGVIDEGIAYWFDELCYNIYTNPGEIAGNNIDDDGNGYIDDIHGWNFYNNSKDVYNGRGDDHGTHVAGTIGAKGGNQIGVIGVAPNVKMVSCKFLGAYGGWDDGAIQALDYLIDLNQRHNANVRLTSNSWGGGGVNPFLKDAIKRSGDAGMLFIAAAGNSAANSDVNPMYPAAYDEPNIISVGASDWSDAKASFSNYGLTSVDLFVPGTTIYSTVPGVGNVQAFAPYSGTSMATPHVAGAAVLYLAGHPSATWQEVKAAILNSVTPVASLNGLCVTGGMLNVSTFTANTAQVQSNPTCTMPVFDVNPPGNIPDFMLTGQSYDPTTGLGIACFSWGVSTDPEGNFSHYELYINSTNDTWGIGGNGICIGGLGGSQPIKFFMRPVDTWGNYGNFTDTITVDFGAPADTILPSTPQSLVTSELTASSVRLDWLPSTDNIGVAGYNVNGRIAGGTWAVKGTVPGTQASVTGLSPGTTYEFSVQAKDASGNLSEVSNIVSIIPSSEDTEAPSIPQSLSLSNITTSSMTLGWSPSSDNEGVPGYKVNWRAVGGSWLQVITTSTSYNFSSLSQGTAYEFNVVAYDASGNNSAQSITVSGTTLNPPPIEYTISSDLSGISPQASGSVHLTWTTTTNGTISQVRVERKKGSGAFVDLGDNLVTTVNGSYVDNENINPGQYTYRIKTTISQGVTTYSDLVTIQIKKK